MQSNQQIWDVAIIGGGLAGLAAAIQLAEKDFSVVLFEKEAYPYHKVCGEYISMESWNFLERLGVPLQSLQLPIISSLQLTAPNGKRFETLLPQGGFGISRFTLDNLLAQIAKSKGVTLLEESRVEEVLRKEKETFEISFNQKGVAKKITAKIAAGAFGKRSNLDVKWKRPFISNRTPGHNNYIGIKYHIQTDWPQHLIGLHNFKDGYCGISKIEGNKYCFCYLTTAQNLKDNGSSIEMLEQNVLSRNPHLKNIIHNRQVVEGFPVSIAQISFSKKAQAENGVLLLGDAAGMITPLCGNGMSMALHSSKIAAHLISLHLGKQLTHQELQNEYTRQWQQVFSNRIIAGRILQRFFGRESISNLFVQLFKTAPFLASSVIKKTHGKPF